MMRTGLVSLLMIIASSVSSLADGPLIENVTYSQTARGVYTFNVTVRHGDTGWKHYADKWEVYSLKGELLGRRTLYHPHVNEQPFTRSLSGVKIPQGETKVKIRVHDSVHGYGKKDYIVELN